MADQGVALITGAGSGIGKATAFAFLAAGFREVSHPTKRRVVMRLDLV